MSERILVTLYSDFNYNEEGCIYNMILPNNGKSLLDTFTQNVKSIFKIFESYANEDTLDSLIYRQIILNAEDHLIALTSSDVGIKGTKVYLDQGSTEFGIADSTTAELTNFLKENNEQVKALLTEPIHSLIIEFTDCAMWIGTVKLEYI